MLGWLFEGTVNIHTSRTRLVFIKLNTGLGPGQLVGRQVLGSPVLGDIQLSLCDKRGNLEVEVRPVRESQKLENSV